MKNTFIKLALASLISALTISLVGCQIPGGPAETPGNSDHTHQYTEEITKAPTCTEEGVKTFTCSCEDSYTEAIAKLPHTEETLDAVAPTCTESGLTEGKHCSECKEVLVAQEIVDALGHDYEGAITTAPTCTDKGVKTYTCKNDPTHTYTEEIDAKGHADADPKDHVCDNGCGIAQGTHAEQATSHTCEYCGNVAGECRDGNNDHKCDVCGTKLSDCKAGTPVIENSTAATCGEAGSYDEVLYCSICGTELNRTKHTVAAIPHSYQETVTKTPTCEETGVKTSTCSVCGNTKTEDVAALGHAEITYEAKAPTCTDKGWDAYVKCSRCDYSTYAEKAALGHNYDAVVTAPDCLNGGYTTHTCSTCGKSYTDSETTALGHNYSAVVTSPDCLNGGYTTYTCTACGASHTGDETAALGHTEEVVAGKTATCLEAGLTDGKICAICGDVLEAQVEIPANGHKYDGAITKAPTCTEAGVMTYTCQNCSDSYTETIEAAGSHDFNDEFICKNCGLDTAEFRLENGGFENGLEGWTVVGNVGSVSSDTRYWVGDGIFPEGYLFGMDGDKMFSAYAPGAYEGAVGTLTSSSFKVGGSGFVTFKVGGIKDGNYVWIDVVDTNTKEILVRYYNGNFSDEVGAPVRGCTLVAYKADLSAFAGREVFFRLSDNADSNYGLFFADSFVTYYDVEPEGFNVATTVDYNVFGTIYDLFNGGFEYGDLKGWWNVGEIGVVTNATGYWGDNISYDKIGEFLFTGVESFGADTMREGNRGALTSSVFEIGGTGWISFRLGGGGNALCYVQVIDASTGEVLARYHQQAQQDAKLIQYVADLSAYIGRTVRIQVVDQADGGWGCVSFDHVVAYYPADAALPEGIVANDIKGNIKYTIENGSFETGNLDGWTMNITEAGAHNTLGWVTDVEIDAGWYAKNDDTKDGRFLFSFALPGDVNCENSKGTLQSSTFSLKQGSFVSFKFGAAGGAQNHDVYIELCRADGSVIARFYNDAPGKVNTRMNSYFYQYDGIEVDCFFRVVDNSTGDYGCLVIDDFRVNLEAAPEGFIEAIR